MAAKTESGGGGGLVVKKVLSAVNDHYGGVIVHVTEHVEPTTFVSSLTSSIAHWMLQGKKGVWIKLPIQRVNLVEAAVKIAYDILGRSESQEGFWYHHADRVTSRSLRSQIYSLCMLQPLSFDIQKQEQEKEAAKWMPYEEYAAQPFVQKYELLKYMHDICKAKIDGKYSGFSSLPSRSYSLQKSSLYVNSSKAPKRERVNCDHQGP